MPFVLLFLPSLLPLAVLPFQRLGALGELPNASVVGGLDPSVQKDIMNTDLKALLAVSLSMTSTAGGMFVHILLSSPILF